MGRQTRAMVVLRGEPGPPWWRLCWSEGSVNMTAETNGEYKDCDSAYNAALRWARKRGLKVRQ